MLCSKLDCQKYFELELFSYKIGPWRRKAGVCMLDSALGSDPGAASRGFVLVVHQHLMRNVQGYLAHKKQHPPRTLQQGHA